MLHLSFSKNLTKVLDEDRTWQKLAHPPGPADRSDRLRKVSSSELHSSLGTTFTEGW